MGSCKIQMEKNISVMFFKTIFKIGQALRNPSINYWLKFLLETDFWSQEQLENYQVERLKELLVFAKKNSKFYQKLYKDIPVENITSLDFLKQIPVLTKKDLLNNNTNIHTQYPFKKLLKASTSGSSGESLVFQREEQADSFNRASIFRGYSWYNIQPWEKNGYFWGFNFSFSQRLKTQLLDVLQNRFRVFGYDDTSFNDFVKKLQKATYVHGYSSMIFQTAKLINEKGYQKPKNIKMIKGTSEKIFEKYQDEVQKAFGLNIISEYGATESGIIAFECPHGNMHLNMEGVIVEEENHEILVTNLQMKSFPIIRYKLGDYIRLAPKDFQCPCGRSHRVLDEVTGRIGENIYGENNIYPSLYFYYIFKNLVNNKALKLNYQVVQNKKGTLQFRIEQELSKLELTHLQEEIVKYFNDDIEFSILQNQKLIETKGKFKSFVSNIT